MGIKTVYNDTFKETQCYVLNGRKRICTVAVWGLQLLLPHYYYLTYTANHEQRWE